MLGTMSAGSRHLVILFGLPVFPDKTSATSAWNCHLKVLLRLLKLQSVILYCLFAQNDHNLQVGAHKCC